MVLMLTQICRQWNKSKDPNMSTHNYNHLMFNKDAKNILEKRQHLPQTVLGKPDVHM